MTGEMPTPSRSDEGGVKADAEGAGPSDDPLPRSPDDAAFAIEFEDAEGLLEIEKARWLIQKFAAALGELGFLGGDLCIALLDDDRMADVHERFMKVRATTDVVTLDNGSTQDTIDAEILLCVDEAGRRAAERRISVERELLLYLVHGALHCLGYLDADDAGAEEMHKREDEVLEAIGVGATFRMQQPSTCSENPRP